jgi:hypothetical protein
MRGFPVCVHKSNTIFNGAYYLKITKIGINCSRQCRNSDILVAGLPLWWPGFDPQRGHTGFVVETMAVGQVPNTNSHQTNCSTFINHPITDII